MSGELALATPATRATLDQVGDQLGELAQKARALAADAKAPRTRDAYRADWATFTAWCSSQDLIALPAEPATVACYITARAEQGRRVSTIARELVSISQAHKLAGHPTPTSTAVVLETMKGLRRRLGTALQQKAPVLVADLRRMLDALPGNDDLLGLLGRRDRALLLVGFAGAFRRSELVALDVADLDFTTDGLVVTLRRSKTDQDGAGRKVGVPSGSSPATCPVRALRAWLDAAGIAEGAIFRGVDRAGVVLAERLSDKGVARAVKRAALAAGLDPDRFAGHSLRAGLATAAAKAGKSERAIMKQTGHRSAAMVRRYIRDASLFDDNAAGGIGL